MAGSPEGIRWETAYLEYHDRFEILPTPETSERKEWNFALLQERVREIYRDHDERYKYGSSMMLNRITGNVHNLKEAVEKEPDNLPLLQKSLTNIVIWTATLANYVYLDMLEPLTEKFGKGCPRCHQMPCVQAEGQRCVRDESAPWGNTEENKPKTIGEWQTYLALLYPNNYWGNSQEVLERTSSRLGDEIEELISSNDLSLADDDIRMSNHDIPLEQQAGWKGEFADVLAWSIAVAEALNIKTGGNFSLEKSLKENYSHGCPFCKKPHCVCPKDDSIFEAIHMRGPNSFN